MKRKPFFAVWLLAVASTGCSSAPLQNESNSTVHAASVTRAVASAAKSGPEAASSGVQGAVASHIDSHRAMEYVQQIVAIGSRPIGSEGHKKTEAYLRAHLKAAGAQTEEDAFTAQTPAGIFPMRNFIARFPGKRDGVIVIASHYDTVYSLPKSYVGANDGGSTSGLLLELAHQLSAQKQRDGYSVWLVFFDGEEAVKAWTATDSVYGSRHLAEKWQKDGTLKQIKAFILMDMIGDSDLNIDRDANSAQWLEDLIGKAAGNLGYQSYFFGRTASMQDDHTPFTIAGVPCADLIDFEYGYNNVFWHTPQDTLDKLSPKSLQVSGDVILEAIRLLEQK